MGKTHDEVTVVRQLSKKRSIKIDTARQVIEINIFATDLGNGSWGKIDYLVNHRGYIVIKVDGGHNLSGIQKDAAVNKRRKQIIKDLL